MFTDNLIFHLPDSTAGSAFTYFGSAFAVCYGAAISAGASLKCMRTMHVHAIGKAER
jgi:hypothetical protein